MISKKQWVALILFNLAYIVPLTAYYIKIQNFEFLWYVLVLLFFFFLILLTLKRSRFGPLILWGLSIWGLLHMAGGGIIVNGDVLYRLHLIPLTPPGEYFILKYDQFVHFYGFAIATIVGFHLLRPYLNENTNWKVVYPLLALVGMGLGAVNEIVEFAAVVFIAETGVGGYANTGLDLVFNALGAIAAVFFIHIFVREKNPS